MNICPSCDSENVGEGSIFDDLDRKMTCFSCGDRFERNEIVELKLETETTLDEAKNLLRELLGRCDYDMNKKIEKFLEDNK